MIELSIEQEQKIQKGILEYVDNICRKENIVYYLGFGTLLGAVRENAFINWDDDIDIYMRRKDFEKFANVISKYPDKRYFFQSVNTDPDFIVPEMQRICYNNTFKWNKKYYKSSFHTGIYFDIFALDYGEKFKSIDMIKSKILKIIHLLIMKKAENIKDSVTIKGKISFVISSFLSIRNWYRLYLFLVNFHIVKNKSKLICFSSPYSYEKNVYDTSIFDSVVYIRFNDKEYPCPVGYDQLLTKLYGNYMLPTKTKSKRIVAYMSEEIK